jgi:PAS domain S-box-containing protein
LRELLRRVDEVRGLSERNEPAVGIDPDDPDALLATVRELVQELERSHRRLIETNVQLVSLREVASSMVGTLEVGETTRLVTRYLCRAFGFEEGFLLLINRETGKLEGTWTHVGGEREQSWPLELPMIGDSGTLARSLWLNRTVVHHAAQRHRPAHLPAGHPLEEVLDTLAATACVPLQRSHTARPLAEPHELCGARCILGDARVLAPPPGPAADTWTYDVEERQRACLACEQMPLLGVIGMARRRGAPALASGDVMLLESIAMSVAPMIENARLYQDLRRSERFRNHVVDSMASALVAVNMSGEILTFNHAAEELLGFTEHELLGQPFGALCGSDGEAIVSDTLGHGREALRVETLLRARDGAPVPVSMTTSLLRNDKRSIYGAIATFVDLTPLKRAEEHARQLDRLAALGRFTSSVAHEIRNPLTGIGTGVQYLARSIPAGDAQHENLQFILSEIRRLDRIVQELFDVTHPRRLALRVTLIEDTLRRAVQCVEALFAQRGVQWTLEIAPHAPPVAHDQDQMQQVFINLLKNAAEASPPGTTIALRIAPTPRGTGRSRSRARSHADGWGNEEGTVAGAGLPAVHPDAPAAPVLAAPRGDGAMLAVEVEDQGSGIEPEVLKTIFEPFFTTKQGGTGLGLYVTHDIVKRHGGNLTVHSETARGTRFIVELPLESNGGQS